MRLKDVLRQNAPQIYLGPIKQEVSRVRGISPQALDRLSQSPEYQELITRDSEVLEAIVAKHVPSLKAGGAPLPDPMVQLSAIDSLSTRLTSAAQSKGLQIAALQNRQRELQPYVNNALNRILDGALQEAKKRGCPDPMLPAIRNDPTIRQLHQKTATAITSLISTKLLPEGDGGYKEPLPPPPKY